MDDIIIKEEKKKEENIMEKTKRIVSIFLVVLMLFTSLPMNAFAEEIISLSEESTTAEMVTTSAEKEPEEETTKTVTEEETTTEASTSEAVTTEETSEPVYEERKTYTIDGVDYYVDHLGKVSASGTKGKVPEKVEILSYLGDYPVTTVRGFNGCTEMKELIIPETVTLIEDVKNTGLEKIEIRADYVRIWNDALTGSPYYNNEENWKNGLFIIGSCLVKSVAEGEVILGEEITSISNACFGQDGKAEVIRIYNPDCKIGIDTNTFPKYSKICGIKDSTAVYGATSHGNKFEELCLCEDTVKVAETETLCDGTLGYTEGLWCERCQVWQRGHLLNKNVTHPDENGDGVCDLCCGSVNENYIETGTQGYNCFWTVNGEGTLTLYGYGSVYRYYAMYNPWRKSLHNGTVKKVVVSKGITSIRGKLFAECDSLETVVIGDTVKEIEECFYECENLKEVILPDSLEIIGSATFEYCSGLEKIVVPDSVTLIESYAFYSCKSLKEINLSKNLKEIEYHAFGYCESLTEIVFPASLETIGNYAFYQCTSLNDIDFVRGYVDIDLNAFYATAAYNNPENIKDGLLIIDGCLIKVISYDKETLVLGPEITSVARTWHDNKTNIKEIKIYNPDLKFSSVSTNYFPSNVTVYGLLNSTAQQLAPKGRFILFCICEDTQVVPESDGYCDGTVGYTEGVWCERCQIWVSGHEKKNEFLHIDENEDEFCDYCRQPVENSVFDSGKCGDDISWFLLNDGTLLFVGTGSMYAYAKKANSNLSSAPWSAYAETGKIKRAEFSDGITSIGDYAFYNCKSLESIELSPVLTTIGIYAFHGCEKLVSIALPETVYSVGEYAFKDCLSLKSIVIPEGVNVLNRYMFSGCKALERVEIKSELVSAIPVAMFMNCENLREITFAGTITSVTTDSFRGCKSLTEFPSEKLTSLGDFAFAYCESLTFFTIKGIDTVPYGLLKGCKSITEINLSGKITSIGREAFSECSAIKNILLPETVTAVYDGAFKNCTSLNSIILPVAVKTLSSRVFSGCEGLETITVRNNKISIAMPLVENGVTYPVIPDNTTVVAEQTSSADVYADKYKLKFMSLTDKKIASVTLIEKPDRSVYTVGESTELDKKGAVVEVVYEDGTKINLINRYTVDMKDTDLAKVGEYRPAIVYGEYEFEYEIIVAESMVFHGVPESRVFNIYCKKDEPASLCFIPDETRNYIFSIGDAAELEVDFARRLSYSTSTIKFTDDILLEEGKEYYFVIKSKTNRTVRILETDAVHFSLLPDGTYEAVRTLVGGDVTVPSEFGGVPVTKIADNFIKNRWSHLGKITVSEGITEIGAGAFEEYKKDVILPDTVKKIGNNAFKKFEGNVNIPSSVEEIGEYAFALSQIGDVVLDKPLKKIGKLAFNKCYNIKNVTVLSDDITYGVDIFKNCTKLENVVLDENISKLGRYMFSFCSSLKSVTGSQKITKIPNGLFYACTALDASDFIDGATEIGSYAFYECSKLSRADFNEKLTQIKDYAFYKCTGIEEVILGENIVSVGNRAFYHCESLRNVTFSENLQSIGEYAFFGCSQIKEIRLPEKIKTIEYGVFGKCSSLETVYAEGEITCVENDGFWDCVNLRNVNFWNTLTMIGHGSFAGCVLLENVSLEKIHTIHGRAFKDCTGLESVTFADKLYLINDQAFLNCTSLKEIIIPDDVEVRKESFSGCTSLEKIVLNDEAVLGDNILNNCTALREIHLYTSFDANLNFGIIPETVTIYGYPGSSAEEFAKNGGYEFVSVEGHVHDFTISVSNPVKCLMTAYNVYTCSCGYKYSEQIKNSNKQHYYGDFTVDKAPTCTEYGLKSKHCYCGQYRKDTVLIEPFGHTEIIDIPAVAPTATEPGYTHQSHCSVCGETVVKRELIGHGEYDIQINDDTVTAQKFDAATNENDGVSITITFELKNQVYLSYIDKTVICKVGEVKLSETRLDYNGKVQNPGVTVKDSTGEPLVLNRDYKLTYSAGSKYSGKYSVRVDYIGNYAGSKTLYYDIVIGAVVPAVSSTDKSISLSWKKGHSDLYYCVYSADSKGNLKKIADTKNGSYTVSSLKSGTEYRFLVRAFVKDGNGKIYWGDKGNSVLCATNPASVSKLTVTPETKSVKLSWSKVSGATGYRVYKYDGSCKMVKDTKSLSCEISGLKSGTAYKFYVRPYKQFSGKTLWSADNKADAVEAYTKPSATSKISYTSSTDSVKLSWNKVTGATDYRIYLYDNAKDKYVKVADTSKNSYTVKKKNGKKLKPGVEYKFRVQAYIKKNGKTYWSDSYKTVTTATKPAKSSLTVTSSKGKVNLSWKDVMGESGYQVYYSTKKDGTYKKLTSLKADKVKYSKKLAKGKKYYFKVRAYKKAGGKTVYGSFSSVKSVKIK